MKSNTKIISFAFVGLLLLGMAVLLPSHDVLAQVDKIQEGINSVGGEGSPSATSAIQTIVNTLLFLIGAISVVMIIFGGFKYVTSSGESSAVASAKNTILYAVVGLVIAISAFVIVNFVTGIFNNDTTAGDAGGATGSAVRDAVRRP